MNIIDEPDWDNSNASLDDDEYSPHGLRDPLHQAKDSKDLDNDSGHTQQTVHAGTLPPQESEQPHPSGPTSSANSLPMIPFTSNEAVGWAIDIAQLL